MGISDQASQGPNPISSSGRRFASVDPERQREIDLDQTRTGTSTRRQEPVTAPVRRTAQTSWFAAQRDASDEGGSSRRDR